MPLAVVLGLVIGFATGGRPRHLGERTFHLWPLLVAGAGLQVAAEMGALGDRGHWLVVGSFAALAVFAVANLRLAGMGVVLIGLLMNVTTIAVNSGMPVEDRAIVAAGLADDEAGIEDINFRAKRHRMSGNDTLYWLSDIVPAQVLGTGQVLSFGDLVMSIGVIDLLANLLHPFPRRRGASRRPRRDTSGTDGETLFAPDAARWDEPVTTGAPVLAETGPPNDDVLDLRILDRYSAASVPGERQP